MTEIQTNGAPPEPEAGATPAPANVAARTGLIVGIAVAATTSAAVTFFLVRAMWKRRPPDETEERIQSLIDEANRLIRNLEEKK